MKKLILTSLTAVALTLGSTFSAWAADKTIEGTASCADGHATVIKVKEGDKLVSYQLAQNAAGKEFHAKVCRKAAQVKATGEVKEVDGEKVFMAKKIELAQK